jgi:two-component system repressor protein LuxO
MSIKSEKYVLVVEDDPFQIKIFGKILERLNCKIILLSKGREALDFLNGEKTLPGISNKEVGLVLLDLALPDVSGIEILRQLKEKNNPVTVAILSATEDLETIIEAIKLGADNFLLKGKDDNHLKRMCDYVEKIMSN